MCKSKEVSRSQSTSGFRNSPGGSNKATPSGLYIDAPKARWVLNKLRDTKGEVSISQRGVGRTAHDSERLNHEENTCVADVLLYILPDKCLKHHAMHPNPKYIRTLISNK